MGKKKQSPPPAFATAGRNIHFTPMYDDQLNSPAFIALPAVASLIYLYLRQQFRGDYTGNKVICTYDMLCDKGISRNTIATSIRILEALGFISCERGGLGNQPSIYRFVEGWKLIPTEEKARQLVKQVRKAAKEEEQFRKMAKEQISDGAS